MYGSTLRVALSATNCTCLLICQTYAGLANPSSSQVFEQGVETGPHNTADRSKYATARPVARLHGCQHASRFAYVPAHWGTWVMAVSGTWFKRLAGCLWTNKVHPRQA